MFEFQKASRLLKGHEFKSVLGSEHKIVHPNFVLYGIKRQECCRLGLIVSKKVGGAVDRNKVKRRIRENFRVLLPELNSKIAFDLVVIARNRSKDVSSQEFHKSFISCLDRLQSKMTK